jgi:hypothetical protein
MHEIVQEWVDKGNSDFIAAKILAPNKGQQKPAASMTLSFYQSIKSPMHIQH